MEPQPRFMAKVEQTSECWNWRAYTGSNGYGRVWFDGRLQLAHRVAYQLFVGPIPAGMFVDHLCRNRSCVNPDHMEIVTARVNILRGDGLAAHEARRTTCVRGHPYSGDNLYVHRGKRYCRACVGIRRSATKHAQETA